MNIAVFDDSAADHVLTVSALTAVIKTLLEDGLPPVWLSGEISNFKHHTSGHFYFSLKDSAAQIPCVMWAGRNRHLRFLPRDGMQVVVQGKVTVYEKRGYYQLEVWTMQPAGEGALQLAFERLKLRLQSEGLFDEAHKVRLPAFPQRVGLVTSPTGAALRDLVSVLRRRWPPIEIILRPVRVQGEGAAEDIARALQEFNAYGGVDVIIVGRGGGSLEDLWPFNEEIVARAIYASELPVVSAVGHEIDFSISDFVADLRAPTPSAAAELVVPDAAEVRRHLRQQLQRGHLALQRLLQRQRERLRSIAASYGLRRPVDLIHQRSQALDETHRQMLRSFERLLERHRRELETTHQRLQALSHENILQRGFALVYREEDGALVRQAGQLQPAEAVRIQFARGRAQAQIRTVSPD
ncbi:MAG: exodeoxyribonuclease VII large subunit [candidate division KSB1 bacterium]|nr:exodeoxyribonuclease VII large subunit [candidate division KSB1 bacterium]MDZ7273797.1 exodeoxyribonuclease VII large subunit [candidate division KSB1 bacterium]MDZ7285953.1 exodeoxyribonuclease VII large subunit [candidate division KSB1 bacterium]MDZ7298985.1 exodeoxyribonuclease VII large subunit [candidate division KSB1 bacterium]MDZ7349870.1 exodeoxyribonuclease VII large subunit [candidate division KSB1 bacterium]